MSDPNSDQVCHFLRLPMEIRQKIYELHFFRRKVEPSLPYNDPVKFEGRKLGWAVEGLSGTDINQIHPYRTGTQREPKFELSIFRTNRIIQQEAEAVFYGWSSFNLVMDSLSSINQKTYEFLEKLPRRYRVLIRRIESRCFEQTAHPGTHALASVIQPYDWKLFMTFLAQECPALQSLKLWAFADGRQGQEFDETCRDDAPWVQQLLKIKSLTFFDIPAIPRGAVRRDQSCAPTFVERLRSRLYRQATERNHQMSRRFLPSAPDTGSHFRFLDLPDELRTKVYRLVLIPADGVVHPYVKSWYDETTRNATSLFLTCRRIHQEAENILYREATFYFPLPKHQPHLLWFHGQLSNRLVDKIQYVRNYEKFGVGPGVITCFLNDAGF